MTDEFDVTQIDVADPEKSIFVFKTQHIVVPDYVIERIMLNWEKLWPENSPRLIILNRGDDLQCLTEAKLTEYGLRRFS